MPSGSPDSSTNRRRLASLDHSNITAICGLEESDGHPHLVPEPVEGKTLSSRLARGRLTLADVSSVNGPTPA